MRAYIDLRVPECSRSALWRDFWNAAQNGTAAVKETFDRAFAECHDDYISMTELVLVLNHLCWVFLQLKKDYIARLFHVLHEQLKDWCFENLTGDELDYFIRVAE